MDWEGSERCIRLGNSFPDKTFFIIRRRHNVGGFFAIYRDVLTKLMYALSKGYIPVVDLQYCRNLYLAQDKFGKENAWEYYFEQPMGATLEDVRRAQNIVLSQRNSNDALLPAWSTDFLLKGKDNFGDYQKIVRDYIRINAKTQNYIEKTYQELFGEKDAHRTIGVLCRGTDYIKLRPKGHPIQPPVEKLIKKVKEMADENHCDLVFLATEEKLAYDLFAQEFGERLRTVNKTWTEYTGGSLGNDLFGYQAGLDYLTAIVILSRCCCFCGGITTGTMGVFLMTQGFEDVWLFDLGLY